jgi:hypothetical protein
MTHILEVFPKSNFISFEYKHDALMSTKVYFKNRSYKRIAYKVKFLNFDKFER